MEDTPTIKSAKPNVILRNEPEFSEHEVDDDLNKMRTEFVSYIQDFVTGHDLFKNEAEVGIEFAHKGVSSIVAIIDSSSEKWVLKIHRSKKHQAGEDLFFTAWEEAGVSVPHILESGEINDLPYTLMNFVDAPTLDTAYSREELLDNEAFIEMGKILRLMHSVDADGYGSVVDEKPEFITVEDWLESEDMKKRFDYIRKHGLLTGLEDTLQRSIEIIKRHGNNNRSTYCHTDFLPANMFATNPITIFDSIPKFNSGYYDLGRIKFEQIADNNAPEIFEQLLKGYFVEKECDEEVLMAYTFLAFCMKARYWHQTGRVDRLEKVRQYFIGATHQNSDGI
jgi:hypothetical protein